MSRFPLPLLLLAFGLTACAPMEEGFYRILGGVTGYAAGSAPPIPATLTVQRVRGGPAIPGEEPLQEEPGNVWPEEEGPRATLANPEEVLRGGPLPLRPLLPGLPGRRM
ncbi:MAG: hypothetical protein N2588_00470 [Rhodovarius sp.]|nr:hypothetical protein [Rhodovarius sp.]